MSVDDTKLLDYVSFRQSTHLSYHRANIRPQDYQTLLPKTTKFVEQDVPTSVLTSSKDPMSVLELGIRQWTGCGAPQNKPEALAGWMYIVSYLEGVPVPLKARAYSSLARAWYDLATENAPRTLQIDRLYDAGNCANEAVALGLISPVTLTVASRIEDAGFRRPQDNRFPEHSTERFERLTDIWEALEARKAEIIEEDSKREAKVSKDPLSYFCAAEDCGIVATKKSTLKRCGGGCPRAFKPSYCSKYCQMADRKHHRPYCRPDATESSVRPTDTTTSTAVARPDPPEDGTGPSEKFKPGPERAININIGRGTLQLTTNTIPPQMLREMREHLESMF
ncbi:hypothetical protein BJ322DRAFT_1111124 [Thelephora terrestris]|uniref:MYND-type domain-containing protein n=1 Tax=Thelephora terrestris TaxID=56493 RepID=A0A9P6L4D2_9AGAM|nr:hypothetical protein BJ322DRAFT_1111124 [Thelephora terrestris]